jgi:predicted lipid-binding transport protein (Tim44 family)
LSGSSTGSSAPANDEASHRVLIALGAIVGVGALPFLVMSVRRRVRGPNAVSASDPRATAAGLAELRQRDPDFSQPAFEDFVARLFMAAHRAQSGSAAQRALAPYVTANVLAELARNGGASAVTIGALGLESVHVHSQHSEIALIFTASVRTAPAPAQYVRERWTLRRQAGVRSKTPSVSNRLGCPSCGDAFSANGSDGTCARCQQVVSDGRFAWHVTQRGVLEQRSALDGLTGTTEEVGTHEATKVDPGNDDIFATLVADDPACNDESVRAEVQLTYDRLNECWNANDLTLVHARLSDVQHDSLRYWLETYAAHGLRNTLTQANLTRVVRAKVVRDHYFDAVTVRILAAGYDVTSELSGRQVGGSSTAKREYSEYWTFIRRARVAGRARVDIDCPKCATPLVLEPMGYCTECGKPVTPNAIDWVLHKIEQDETYV